MRLSIVAPNLNEMPTFERFLRCLVTQTFKDFEVVIVDGGSTNGSLKVIEQYKEALNLKLIIDKTRNIGYIRNVGVKNASGEIIINTASDTYFEPKLLQKVVDYFDSHPSCIALAGRTFPIGTNFVSKMVYPVFDLLRFVFTIAPMAIRKFRPSGNFLCIKQEAFQACGGYPEVEINEDGLFGEKLDDRFPRHTKVFHVGIRIGHHVKTFETIGGLKGLGFYVYVLGNMFRFLRPLLKSRELQSAKEFIDRRD